jgi:phosphoserine phosphatase
VSRQPLVVLDLDGTLVPYDSLRRYCFCLLRTSARWEVLNALLRRAIKLDSAVDLLDRLDKAVRSLHGVQAFHQRFAENLRCDMLPDVLSFVRGAVTLDARVVLCSASPEAYVLPLSKAMNWECVASGRRADGKMVRVHGVKKLEHVLRAFPPQLYSYDVALADAVSDIPLLIQFESAFLVQIRKEKVVIKRLKKAN